MAIRSDDITQIIRSAIDEFDAAIETRSVGTVVEVGDGIARIYGLEGALASELLEFPGGVGEVLGSAGGGGGSGSSGGKAERCCETDQKSGSEHRTGWRG